MAVKEEGVAVWTEFVCLLARSSDIHCEHGHQLQGSVQGGEFH